MEPEDIQGKKFPGSGRCIYCDRDGGGDGLRDEHIVPLSLGGKAVIANASCSNCEKVTSYLDGYLGRHVFYEYRLHTGMKSPRRKAKPKPTALAASVVLAGREEERLIPSSRPSLLFGAPGLGATRSFPRWYTKRPIPTLQGAYLQFCSRKHPRYRRGHHGRGASNSWQGIGKPFNLRKGNCENRSLPNRCEIWDRRLPTPCSAKTNSRRVSVDSLFRRMQH
jgi:HNH endonuclease